MSVIYIMKLNFKKMKLNQVILVVAIIVIVGWLVKKSRKVENLVGNPIVSSEIVLYVESRDEPNPFIVHSMAKELTDDNNKLEKILELASQGKNVELLSLVKSL